MLRIAHGAVFMLLLTACCSAADPPGAAIPGWPGLPFSTPIDYTPVAPVISNELAQAKQRCGLLLPNMTAEEVLSMLGFSRFAPARLGVSTSVGPSAFYFLDPGHSLVLMYDYLLENHQKLPTPLGYRLRSVSIDGKQHWARLDPLEKEIRNAKEACHSLRPEMTPQQVLSALGLSRFAPDAFESPSGEMVIWFLGERHNVSLFYDPPGTRLSWVVIDDQTQWLNGKPYEPYN